VVTSTDPIIATLAPENTLDLKTIPTVTVRMKVPWPGMELLPDQQQTYQEEQQAQTRAQQIDVEWWAAQCHDDLASEQVALDAQMTELHGCKAKLETEQGTTIDYAKVQARTRVVAAVINHVGMPHSTFARAS
jgi:hypothetical protein